MLACANKQTKWLLFRKLAANLRSLKLIMDQLVVVVYIFMAFSGANEPFQAKSASPSV